VTPIWLDPDRADRNTLGDFSRAIPVSRTTRDVDGALSLADGGNSGSGCKSAAWRSGSQSDHLIE
jgi:hypothetical protein